ncbi:MAG: branched-chain amino acid transport system substrate-binding protein [Reinekea sp.]
MVQLIWTAFMLNFFVVSALTAETFEIYIDADYSISRDAAESIELGVSTALSQSDFGSDIEIIPKNHRGNVRRSFRTMKEFLKNDRALVMIGGLHSPPYLTHRDFINKNELLLLLPWSAAGPVTRSAAGDQNWIFRLSVDDFKTAPFFIRETLDHGNCKNLALVLIDTGWGRANFTSLTEGLDNRAEGIAIVRFFSASIGEASAQLLAEDVARSGADCAVLLANWDSGAVVVNALSNRTPDLRIFSHWGILGGAFAEQVSHETRKGVDLRVLQTCGLQKQADGSSILSDAVRAAGLGGAALNDIPASTGFVHGYDLTRILMASIKQARATPEWGGDIIAKRRAVRMALENLNAPIHGILKSYSAPFLHYTPETPDAHEALGLDDLCMAVFEADGRLSLTQ